MTDLAHTLSDILNRSIKSLLAYLRAIRQPYLSTAPPPRRTHAQAHQNYAATARQTPGSTEIPAYLNDTQREDIDSQTALLLNDINRNITNLSSAAKLQNDTATKVLEKKYGKPSGFLFRWAAGDAANEDAGKDEIQLKDEGEVKAKYAFREGVIWYLNYELREVVGVQENMVSIRLDREREKRESVLWDARNKNYQHEVAKKFGIDDEDNGLSLSSADVRGKDTYNPAMEGSVGGGVEGLSPEQLQLFEEENNSLLNHYTDTLAKVTQAEKSLVDISSLQQTLVGHLTVQGEMIGQLVEDASRTDENVRRGNKELKKASERGSLARGVFWGTVSLCSFLVVWDLIF